MQDCSISSVSSTYQLMRQFVVILDKLLDKQPLYLWCDLGRYDDYVKLFNGYKLPDIIVLGLQGYRYIQDKIERLKATYIW